MLDTKTIDRIANRSKESMQLGDTVTFLDNSHIQRTGRVERRNKVRARINSNGTIWYVPYRLINVSETPPENPFAVRGTDGRLEEVRQEARRLMDKYGLEEWDFKFDNRRRNWGTCWHNQKLITLNSTHARGSDPSDATDTILHEIAHALVGSHHAHGKVWKDMARRLGAIPLAYGTSRETRQERAEQKNKFHNGAKVFFKHKFTNIHGTIKRMNPKRAQVSLADGRRFYVPYSLLNLVHANDCPF